MASVKRYSLRSDGNKNLSANFKVREFACKDGSDEILICQETVNILQAVRDYFGKPVTINSAYRTPSHNKKVGGASASQHVKGTACDIRVSGVPSTAVAAFLEANYPKHGIGLYGTFVHVDSRGYKVYWKNSGSNTVSSFRLGTIYTKYKAKTPVTTQPKPTVVATPVKKKEEDVVTYTDFKKFMEQYEAEKKKELPGSWSEEDRAWAITKGFIKGDGNGNYMWQDGVTREQLVAILHRLLG